MYLCTPVLFHVIISLTSCKWGLVICALMEKQLSPEVQHQQWKPARNYGCGWGCEVRGNDPVPILRAVSSRATPLIRGACTFICVFAMVLFLVPCAREAPPQLINLEPWIRPRIYVYNPPEGSWTKMRVSFVNQTKKEQSYNSNWRVVMNASSPRSSLSTCKSSAPFVCVSLTTPTWLTVSVVLASVSLVLSQD